MCVVLQYFVVTLVVVDVSCQRDIFNQDADSLFQEIIGDINIERKKWTTPHIEQLRDQLMNFEEVRKKLPSTTTRTDVNNKASKPDINAIEDFKMRKRIRNVMYILNNQKNPIPSFERGDDDTAMITRRFDQMQKEVLRTKRWRIRVSNVWRNRTFVVMDHFVHATRYKLPYSQMLRKKYHGVIRYRIGYCFGLLNHLKRQQLYLYSTLQMYRVKVYFLHMHMRIYEKIVRLDVDIKDIIRMLKTLESRRRIESDPKYYDEYYEDESTTEMKSTAGVQEVKVTEFTMPKAKIQDKQLSETTAEPVESKNTDPPGRRF